MLDHFLYLIWTGVFLLSLCLDFSLFLVKNCGWTHAALLTLESYKRMPREDS